MRCELSAWSRSGAASIIATAPSCGELFRRQTGFLNDRLPARDLALQKCLHFLRGVGGRFNADADELLPQLGMAEDRVNLAVQPHDNFARRVGGREGARPA